MVEVDELQGLHDAIGLAAGHADGEHRRDTGHGCKRQEHGSKDGKVARLALRKAHHAAVGQSHGLVQHDLPDGGAGALRGTVPVRAGLLDLGTGPVVVHVIGLRLGVVDHLALGGDQRDARALQAQAVQQTGIARGAVERRGHHIGLLGQLIAGEVSQAVLHIHRACPAET